MAGITLCTARQVVPMIYAYTTPEIARHNGWTKIGYTEQSRFPRLSPQAPGGERPQKRVVPSGWGAVPAVFSGFPHEPGQGAAGCRHRLHPAGGAGKGCP